MLGSKNPKVTVLVDTFNHERFIHQALLSVLTQDFPKSDMEILVVDDGSTDLTPEIVRRFGADIRLLRKPNGGQGSAFNAGIPNARGEIVAFLDGDDWWAPNKVSRVVDYFDRHPEVGVLGHGYYQVNSLTGETTTTVPRDPRSFSFDSEEDVIFFRHLMCFFGTSRVVIRKSVLERTPPIPDAIVIEADEFMSVMSIAQSKGALLAEPLTFYRLHEDNLYQFQSRDLAKLRRLCGVLNVLAAQLRLALTQASVAPRAIEIIVHTLETGAKKLRLQLDGGTRIETFRIERAEQKFYYAEASIGYRLFQALVLSLTLMMKPERFYRLRNWYASSRFRKWRSTLGDPVQAAPIKLRIENSVAFRAEDSSKLQ
jgi:glycosyltransferase involved in cell wall biosynthesis